MPRRRASIQAPIKNETDTDIAEATTEADPIEAVVEVVEEIVVEAPVKQSKTIATEVGPVATKEEPQPEMPREGVPDGIILGPNDPLKIEAEDHGNVVIVKRDVYRETYPRRATRPSYILLYPRGSQVLKSTLVPLPEK